MLHISPFPSVVKGDTSFGAGQATPMGLGLRPREKPPPFLGHTSELICVHQSHGLYLLIFAVTQFINFNHFITVCHLHQRHNRKLKSTSQNSGV